MAAKSQTGFFITFEGSEGCGKSTQIQILLESLRAAGCDPLFLREPGGTLLGEQIRHLLKHAPEGASMVPETELLLFAASRAQLTREIIQPALAAGRVVVSDRFLDSTTVYQGVARAIPGEQVARINTFAAGSRLPDLTFLLDMDAGLALRRAKVRSTSEAPDRLEQEPLAFYQAVRQGYLDLAAAHPARFRVLDASQPIESISTQIRNELHHHGYFQGISL